MERERPSKHGKILGDALATISEAGRSSSEVSDLDPCATCAFRRGSMPNQMAATGLTALNIVLRIDSDDFACHHGMKDGNPTRLCAGYLHAKAAPFEMVKSEISAMKDRLADMSGPDEVRAAFDAWRARSDPSSTLDDYQLARLFARSERQ